MAKKITAVVKLQLPAGKATPAPPVGSTLGPFGINLPGFTKEFNAKTADKPGLIIPVVVTIYQDRSFTFILKTPPAPVLIKKALGIETASAKPNSVKVGKLTKAQVEEMWLTHFSPSLVRAEDYMPAVRKIFANSYLGKDGKTKELLFQED